MNIDQVAKLARIKLTEEERTKLSKDLEEILRYVKKLEGIDTRDVPPTSHVLEIENVFRKDEVRRTEVKEEVLRHAPETENGFFKVPKVIEG